MITELAPDWTAEPLVLPNEDEPPKDSKQTTEEINWLTRIDTATVRSSALASLTLKQRSPLLADWLCEGDYGIIFASRGVGKTWFGR